MTTLRQAAQQALEALEKVENAMYVTSEGEAVALDKALKAITALREALAQEHAMHEVARLGQEIEQELSQWRDMVVVTLVREGIDKHKARELADHFAAQRPWQVLTEQDMPSGENPMFDHQYFCAGMVYAAKVLQEKNK